MHLASLLQYTCLDDNKIDLQKSKETKTNTQTRETQRFMWLGSMPTSTEEKSNIHDKDYNTLPL